MLLSAWVAAPAWATPTWTGPAKLSATGASAESPSVAVNAGGDALAAWERTDKETGKRVIEVASRPAGAAAWGSPLTISEGAVEGTLPQVALDSAGDGFAAWLSKSGTEYSILASTRTGLGGAWTKPVPLETLGMTVIEDAQPRLSVDAKGDAIVVWEHVKGSEAFVESSSRPAGASSWGPSQLAAEKAEPMHNPEVGLDSGGNATVVWEAKGATNVLIDAARKPAGGNWGVGVPLSESGGNANVPRLAVAGNGDAIAIWERFGEEEGNMAEIIEASTRSGGGASFSHAARVTKIQLGRGEVAGQHVALDEQGDAVVTWSETNTTKEDLIEASVGKIATDAWGKPVVLSGAGDVLEEEPQVTVSPTGEAVVAWERPAGPNSVVEAASGLASSGEWQTAVPLSGKEADEQQLSVDARGDVVALWRHLDGGFYLAEADVYDAAGPLLGSLAIPARGVVGEPLTFSVSPFDAFSALAATTWGFGDGTSATGPSVTHTYAKAGSFPVSVTSADVLGNLSATAATVTIVSSIHTGPLERPRISGAMLTHKRFRVGKGATAITAHASPKGTIFRFTLSEPAKLTITFSHSVAGLRSGRRCAKPSAKLRHAHARHCRRTVTIGTLTRAKEPKGSDSIAFSGRLGHKPLKPGAYTATLIATAAAVRSSPVKLSLTILR
ncbi:MAG TPA: PKD domain-containing protein [Solirubrobacteraceae bacterium]|nr:PKD domain-containing protein [Solirubrobacteraceae bacterium]